MDSELVSARLDEAANVAWLKFWREFHLSPFAKDADTIKTAYILGFKCGSIFGHTLAEEVVNRKEES